MCCDNAFLFHSRKGKEIETQTLCIRWETESLQKILERKVYLAVQGEREREAQQKLYQAEAEVEARNWENRKFGFHFSKDQSRI